MIVYTKRGCMWCEQLIDFLNENDVEFEEREMRGNPTYFEEVMNISGQTLAPTVVLDDVVCPDTDREFIGSILNI